MKIVVKKVGQKPEVNEIQGTLEEYKEIVGGYIECFDVIDNIVCICNEEGKLNGLPANFIFGRDVIVGDVFFCTAGEEDFESLDDCQVNFIMSVMTAIDRQEKKIKNIINEFVLM